MCLLPCLEGYQSLDLGLTLFQYDLILTWLITCAKTLFQIRSILIFQAVINLGRYCSIHYRVISSCFCRNQVRVRVSCQGQLARDSWGEGALVVKWPMNQENSREVQSLESEVTMKIKTPPPSMGMFRNLEGLWNSRGHEMRHSRPYYLDLMGQETTDDFWLPTQERHRGEGKTERWKRRPSKREKGEEKGKKDRWVFGERPRKKKA